MRGRVDTQMEKLLSIIAAALVLGADYAARLIAAYDAPQPPAEGGTVKFIVRVDSLAKNGTTRAYVNRYVRVGKSGERMETVAQAKGLNPEQARAWLVNACAALDKRTDVKLRTATAAANVSADALADVLSQPAAKPAAKPAAVAGK